MRAQKNMEKSIEQSSLRPAGNRSDERRVIMEERSKMGEEITKALLSGCSTREIGGGGMKMKSVKICLSNGLRNARR